MNTNNISDCIFCKIIKKEIPADIFFENEYCIAFLDIHPLNPGHSLVIPKEHHPDIFSLPEKTMYEIHSAVKKVADILKKVVSADGINIGQNNGQAAGQVIFHYHVHVIPRYLNDGYISWKAKKQEYNRETLLGSLREKIN